MDWNEILFEPRHLGVPSGVSKMISEPMSYLAQTVHLSYTKTNNISKWTKNELSYEPRHQGVPSGGSKMISKAMVHFAQTVPLSCTKTNTVSKRTETGFHLSLVTKDYNPVHPNQFLRL
jgi:hypothetical protein